MNYERVWAEIDLDCISANVRNISRHIPDGKKIIAIVKANGYGHGAVEVSKTALYSGADSLGVAVCEEGVELRQNNIHAPILVLGYTPDSLLDLVIHNRLTQTVFSLESARALSQAAVKYRTAVKTHIKVDTGMSRLGFLPCLRSVQEIKDITRLPGIEVEGIYTHFAQSDAPDQDFTYRQCDAFRSFVSLLGENGVEIPAVHMANSGSILQTPGFQADYVRAGIIMYGLAPSPAGRDIITLSPAMSLKARISQTKTVPMGASVGYGRTYFTERETTVAVVPVGYADGFSRKMSRGGKVLVNGLFAPIIGVVCMDQFMADVTDIPGVHAGAECVLMGEQGGNRITADDIAAIQDTINYEIICGVSRRVPRHYYKNGQIIRTERYLYTQ